VLIEPHIWTPQEEHEFGSWTQSECYRFYVQIRRKACTFREVLDLWLRVPYCESCALSDAEYRLRIPEISSSSWEGDVAWSLGTDRLRAIRKARRADPDYALSCKRCARSLRPWSRDDVWVVSHHLEERYGIPIEAEGRTASEKLRRTILALYGRRCFGCGARGGLHLDHILPRSKGGTAAFRNLQPLCEACGQAKGDDLPEEIQVFSDLYFDSPPSDAYEGLFW
jgi:5-methylcytosine-specific restriction endonuclease McrA